MLKSKILGFPFMILLVALVTMPISAAAADFSSRPELANHIHRLSPIYRPTSIIDLPANRAAVTKSVSIKKFDTAKKYFRISGRIEKGDLAKLQNFIKSESPNGGLYYPWGLVLDSHGGDFQEGIAIGKWLRENLSSSDPNFLGSYVLKGDECLSACALIFALSSSRRTLDDSDSSNFIELGGRLGFHMGILPDKLASQKIAIRDSMNMTYDIMAAYMVLVEEQTSPPDLIIEALKARDANSFFYVEASPRAYDLGFIPVSASTLSEPLSLSALPMDRIRSMCRHLRNISQIPDTLLWRELGGLMPTGIETASEMFKGRETEVLRGQFSTDGSCLIGRSPNGNLMIDVTDQEISCKSGTDRDADWCVVDKEHLYFETFATNGLLADISGCPMGTLHPLIDRRSNVTDRFASLPASFGAIEISRAVNMRAKPSLTADRVGELAVGTKMRIRECAVTLDNQAIWLKVASGQIQGWISARFAEVWHTSTLRFEESFEE